MNQEQSAVSRQQHWDHVYATKAVTAVSWFESEPQPSLDLVTKWLPRPGRIIDMGGGASRLVDRLLDKTIYQVTVLDISARALQLLQNRLGDRAAQVDWLVGDVTQLTDVGRHDLWHDRAVFHFLTAAEDRRAYLRLASRTLAAGGVLVLATFANNGPLRCSGLDTCRYTEDTLANELVPWFEAREFLRHQHQTPGGTVQNFLYAVLTRTSVPIPAAAEAS